MRASGRRKPWYSTRPPYRLCANSRTRWPRNLGAPDQATRHVSRCRGTWFNSRRHRPYSATRMQQTPRQFGGMKQIMRRQKHAPVVAEEAAQDVADEVHLHPAAELLRHAHLVCRCPKDETAVTFNWKPQDEAMRANTLCFAHAQEQSRNNQITTTVWERLLQGAASACRNRRQERPKEALHLAARAC